MKGKIYKASQSWLNPNIAPVCEYVPTPEGSSSEAPVTKPGPIILNNFFR
jgi:hypothetical protein